ncbi:MAG: YbhB/YbcL family Raf kinase inhibitor-like protein [Dehalococcoidia bacterium]
MAASTSALITVCAALALALAVSACGGNDDTSSSDGEVTGTLTPAATGAIVFTSQAFDSGDEIPVEYTCQGQDTSPPLSWTNVPDGTQAFAVELIDPDAGGFVHWLLFDIPAELDGLPGTVPKSIALTDGSKQAISTTGETGYAGPCPPRGQTHEYVFRIYALDEPLGLDGGGSARNVQEALALHTLAMSELVGTYGR